MTTLVAIVSLILIAVILLDVFETIILPRRVTRHFRITRVVYRATWAPWAAIARRMPPGSQRESFLSFYGPLALLFLLTVWALALVVGFAGIQWALGSNLVVAGGGHIGFGTDLYMSGTTLFTLGLGDVVPLTPLARAVTVVEAGMGFALLAVVIGYLPVLYQAFSRREVTISLLDARAGSPPSATEFLRRHGHHDDTHELAEFLRGWERWAAELMESLLSYPSLAYFRSQHVNQSWVAALTAILDTCAMVMVGVNDIPDEPARLTFAMARHAAVDLTQVFNTRPTPSDPDRLPPQMLPNLRATLAAAGVTLRDGEDADRELAHLRRMYEPYVNALSERLLLPLPSWLPLKDEVDDWKSSAWDRVT